MDLNIIWFLLVGILVIGYAILDGFDLGVGTLYFFIAKNDEEKRILLNSIGPVWDANEVWLLTGGGALFAAFPIVYASVFSGFYLAIMLVLFGLILRAVAIEFRSKDEAPRWRSYFDVLFSLGSFLPALLFGVAMGNVAEGIPLDSMHNYTGSFLALLNPYALLFGLVGLFAFLMQGVTYSLLKTEGNIFRRVRELAIWIWAIFIGLYVVTSIYSLLATPELFINYQKYPLLFLIPFFTWLAMIFTPVLIRQAKHVLSFVASSISIAGIILTLALGMFPNLVLAKDPAMSLNIYNASSSPLTLKIMLIIAIIGVPIVLVYTSYVYWVFRGKTKLDNKGGY